MSKRQNNVFAYEAFDDGGKRRRGDVEALTKQDALQVVHGLGLTPVTVFPKRQNTAPKIITFFNIFAFGVISNQQRLDFFRMLSILLEAGIAIDEALRSLYLEKRFNSKMNRYIEAVYQDITAGSALSEAIARHDQLLAPQYASLIAAGEQSGTLRIVLRRLSENMETVEKRRSEIQAALVYPVILILGSIATMIVIAVFLSPIVQEIVSENGGEIPPVFVVMEWFRAIVTDYLFVTLALVGLVGVGLLRWIRTQSGIRTLYAIGLRTPAVGIALRKIEIVKFSSALGLLLQNGVPILRAMDLGISTLSSPQFQDAAYESREAVAAGGRIMDSDKLRTLAPNPSQKMIEVGESTGKLGELLQKLSEIFDDDVQRFINTGVGLITPILTLLIGGGVGFVIFSVMSAILDLNSLVGI